MSVSSIFANANDFALLEKAYQIGRYIHTNVTTCSDDNEKPWSNYKSYFNDGPNYFYNQTETGLVLELSYMAPTAIHTPYGRWMILGSTSGDFSKVIEAITTPLGLTLLQKEKVTPMGQTGPLYAITAWKNEALEKPIYRKHAEYVPNHSVIYIWERFRSSHQIGY